MTVNENIRVNRVLKEFNIGMGTLIDFLKSKKIEIEASPATKLSPETYALIQKEFGKLKVKPVDTEVVVTITEHSGTGIYDGNKQTVTGYDVTNISNTLYSEKDFSFNGNAVIEGTNAGSYNMELKAADFENISKNFTNVKIR